MQAALELLPLPPSPVESCTYLSIGSEFGLSADDVATKKRESGAYEGTQAARFHREFPISARVLIGGGDSMPAAMCIDANIEHLASCANRDTLWTILDILDFGMNSSIEDGDRYEVQLREHGISRTDNEPDPSSLAAPKVSKAPVAPDSRYRSPCVSAPAYYPSMAGQASKLGLPGM